MNLLKVTTAAACLTVAGILSASCDPEEPRLGPPQPADGEVDSGIKESDDEDASSDDADLIDGEIPTCLEGEDP